MQPTPPPPKSDPNCPRCGGLGWRTYNGELYRDGTIVAGQYRCECGWPWMDWYSEKTRAERAVRDTSYGIGQHVIYKGLVRATVAGHSSKRILIAYPSPKGRYQISAWVSRKSLQPIEEFEHAAENEQPTE